MAELGLSGQIMRRILQAGVHQPHTGSSRDAGTLPDRPRSQWGQSLSLDHAACEFTAKHASFGLQGKLPVWTTPPGLCTALTVRLCGWSGEEGVTRVSVAQSLGLTSKRANRALAAFAAKHRIRESFAQQGKAQIKVCSPPAITPGWCSPDHHIVVQWCGDVFELEVLHTLLPQP